MKFFVIGDEDTVLGFKLVGVEGRIVKTISESKEAFKIATATPEVGIIIITEKIAGQIKAEVEKYIYEINLPLVIEIPDWEGPLPGRKSIAELVKSAVGIKI